MIILIVIPFFDKLKIDTNKLLELFFSDPLHFLRLLLDLRIHVYATTHKFCNDFKNWKNKRRTGKKKKKCVVISHPNKF